MKRYRCNPSERLFCLINDLHNGEGMITSGIRIRGFVDPDRLHDALRRLQARHGKLRSRVEYDKKGWPWFVEMDPIVPISCEFRAAADPSESQQILLHAWPDQFPLETSPPVQLIVLKCPTTNSTDIIGWFHHSVFDGLAVWQFFQELLAAYTDPQACLEPAPAGFELYPRKNTGFWGDLKWFATVMWMRVVMGLFHPVKTFCKRPVTGTAYKRQILTPELTRRIVEASRRNNVTVTGALAAAGCRVLAKEFSWHGELIAMPTPRDMRPDYHPAVEPGTLGSFAAIYEVVVPLPTPEEDFWNIARRYVDEAKSRYEWIDPIRGLRLLERIPVGMLKRAGTARGALIVNNLGRVFTKGSPQLPELLDYYGYGRTKKLGASALVLTAGTCNDRMSVALATGCFDQATIDRIHAAVIAELDEATRTPAITANAESEATRELVEQGSPT